MPLRGLEEYSGTAPRRRESRADAAAKVRSNTTNVTRLRAFAANRYQGASGYLNQTSRRGSIRPGPRASARLRGTAMKRRRGNSCAAAGAHGDLHRGGSAWPGPPSGDRFRPIPGVVTAGTGAGSSAAAPVARGNTFARGGQPAGLAGRQWADTQPTALPRGPNPAAAALTLPGGRVLTATASAFGGRIGVGGVGCRQGG
jgi:hypothetical protein